MRKKSSTKLQQIVDAAARLFVEHGFSCTSMSQIAECVGGSKATLYSYFPSKDKIYMEVLMQSAHKLGNKAFDCLEGEAPLLEKLTKFSKEYLAFVLSPPMIDIRRTFFSEAHKTGMGKTVYECGFKKKWQRVADLLAAAMQAGEMTQADPWIAAMQLRALIEVDLADRRTLGIVGSVSDAEINEGVARALDVYCAYYRIARSK